VPFTFPSHPGLILPLWVARPRRFDALALAVGSVLPDIMDAAIERPSGDVHQNFAHSLVGLATLCVPVGFALVHGTDLLVARLLRPAAPRWIGNARGWLRRLVPPRPDWRRVMIAVSIGAFSHLFFDAFTHRRFDWLRPWVRPNLRPNELAGDWLSVRFRGMEDPWGIGLFGLMWLCWSALGALLFVWCCWEMRKYENWR
jgi:hypothetical protein